MKVCGGCHDINRARAGYTPQGWRTVMQMMSQLRWRRTEGPDGTLTEYLIKSFPERPRPPAVLIDGPVQASIKLWQVPTPGSRPHDPLATRDGAIWYTGQMTNKLGRVDPRTGASKEYTLETPHTGPHGLVEDKDGNIWFTGNHAALVGKLDPKSGEVTEYRMPDPKVRDPHSLAIDPSGNVWFTAQQSNVVGRVDPKTGEVGIVTVPTPRARPYGILINSKGVPVLCEFGTNKLATIDPKTMEIKEYALPDPATRPRRIALGPTTSSGTRISRAAISAASIRPPARTRNGPRRAARSRRRMASSSPRARSGTTNHSPSRTPSCASTRRPRRSRPGRFPAAATSCARWTSPPTATR